MLLLRTSFLIGWRADVEARVRFDEHSACEVLDERFLSAAWRSRLHETHGFASRPRDRFALIEELRLNSAAQDELPLK